MHWVDQDNEFAGYLSDLLERSKVPLSISDRKAEDCPLVAVNDSFCDLTGYSAPEVLGRNCRFLQPAGGAGPVRQRIRDFINSNDRMEDKFLLANKRKDGTDFLNLLYLGKLTYGGDIRLLLGSQFEITRYSDADVDLYEQALQEDLRKLSKIGRSQGWVMVGTYGVLAKSQALIAQAKLDVTDDR